MSTPEETRRQRTEYSERLRGAQMREGFAYTDDKDFVTRPYWPLEPRNAIVPHLWKWNEVHELTRQAGEMIGLGRGGAKYDRRVLALINPGVKNQVPEQFTMSGPLFGDIQLIQPGEAAPCHRHTPCATRFILQGEGGWTSVAGEKVHVAPGDLIYTGQFPWHDHGNDGPDDFIFLDVLDIPLLQFTATSAWEFNSETVTGSKEIVNQPVEKTDFENRNYTGELKPRFKAGWKRDPKNFAHLHWEDARASLTALKDEKGCAYDGIRLEWTSTGGGPIGKTVSIFTQMLRPKESTLTHRHTTSTIYVAAEGAGEVTIEGKTMAFSENDIFVIPSWHWHSFKNQNGEPCFLHSINEASLICKMGLYREQRKTAGGQVEDSGWQDEMSIEW